MKRLPVIIPPKVRDQIREQMLYIARDSIDRALAWKDRVQAAILAIGTMPGHAIDEDAADRIGETLRKLVSEGTYLIHYRVDEAAATVQIVNIRHGARLPRADEP